MSESLNSFDVESLTVNIHQDDTRMDFEEAVGESDIKLCSFNPRSNLKQQNEFDTPEDVVEFCLENDYVALMLHRYEHGQVMFTAGTVGDKPGYPYNDQWDAGIDGFILIPNEGYEQPAIEVANSYLSTVSDWCNGSIYGYTIEDDDGEELDSCWGFIGYDHVEQSATEAANGIAEQLPKQLEIEGLAI